MLKIASVYKTAKLVIHFMIETAASILHTHRYKHRTHTVKAKMINETNRIDIRLRSKSHEMA